MSENKIECPNCGHLFDVEAVLAHQAEHRIRQEMENTYAGRFKDLESEKEGLQKDKDELKEKKAKLNETFKERLDKELAARQKELKEETEKQIKEDYQLQLTQMQEEIEKRKLENRTLKEEEIKLKVRENALKEKAEELELTVQKQLLEGQKAIEDKVRVSEREAMALREREYQKQLDDQKKLIEEMKRKAEQGSMQMQGEVQELAIEEWLESNFPLDKVEEIKKGQRGGDCYQVVNSRTNENCGIIYYESKRTKHFKQEWIAKLKDDMTAIGADIGVIVTEAMPESFERMGLYDGVWVCSFEEFKGLSYVLRETILKIHSERGAQENKGDKMVMLYSFLTSNEFKLQIESIVDAFVQMQQDLESEKRSMQRIWKSREKQIQRVILNTNHFYASVKGIAGNAIGTISALELPEGEEDGLKELDRID